MNSALNTAIQETTSGILISLAAAKSEVTVEQLRGDLSVRFGSGGNIGYSMIRLVYEGLLNLLS